MACNSCSRNNGRRSGTITTSGCRRAVQSTRWPSCEWYSRNSGCGCGSWNNGCGCSGGCNSCSNGCNSCSHGCGCSSCGSACTTCGSSTFCSDSGKTAYAAPGNARSAYGSGCGWGSWRSGWNGCRSGRDGCTSCSGYDSCYPFYCGPCGTVNPVCGCNSCSNGCGCSGNCGDCGCGCSGSCNGSCPDPVFGYFTQVGSINIGAGGIVPFNGSSTVEGIWKDGGTFTLEEAGVYLATLTAFAPGNTALYTELDVRVNGVPNPGGTIIIDKVATDPPQNASAQTVITVNEGAVVTVTSSEALNLSADDASDPLITLTLVKIG